MFIHVPKTGGNSIQSILINYSEDNLSTNESHQDGVERFDVVNDLYKLNKHSRLMDYKKKLDNKTFDSLFKFSVIRNPWDRMISYYFSPHRNIQKWNRNDFIKMVKREKSLEYYLKTNIFSSNSFENLDFLIKFENIDEDFKKVCDLIGVKNDLLPRRNKSDRAEYKSYYDEELKQLIEKKFSKEIEYGNYSF